MGVGGVYTWVNRKAKKTPFSPIEEQLPDAVELMVRSLRVGHPATRPPSASWPRKFPTPWEPNSAS